MDRGDLPRSAAASTSDGSSSPQWYSRTAVDEFLASADVERRRLEAIITDARERLARATAAAGLQQTVVEMMLDLQREVADIRRTAELVSAGILAPNPSSSPSAAPPASIEDREVFSGPARTAVSTGEGGSTAPPSFVDPLGGRPRTDRSDEAFFEYLKDELDRDEPLGPMQP